LEKEVTDAEVEDLKRQLEDMKTEREKVSDNLFQYMLILCTTGHYSWIAIPQTDLSSDRNDRFSTDMSYI
jgi:hypothetical protein